MKTFQFYLKKIEKIKSKYNKQAQRILKKISSLEQLRFGNNIDCQQELVTQYDKLIQTTKKKEKEIYKYNRLIEQAHKRAYDERNNCSFR